jgi:hypothetical protein
MYEPIRLKDWGGRPTLESTALKTPIHYHTGTATDGQGQTNTSYEYLSEGIVTHSSITQGLSTSPNNSPFGKGGFLLRKPKLIRVLHNAGWYGGFENYPMTLGSIGIDGTTTYYDPTWESIYLPGPVGLFGTENFINYYADFKTALNTYCVSNKIACSYNTITTAFDSDYSGPTSHGTGIPIVAASGFNALYDAYRPRGHPGRWMYNLAPRYKKVPVNSNRIGTDPTTDLIDIGDVLGGEVLNIVFVSDAYSGYHGSSVAEVFNDSFDSLLGIGNRAAMMADIQRIKSCYSKFKHWGLIIVNSCKNAEFFPRWYNDHSIEGFNLGISYCLYDAQMHLNEVNGLLTGYNTTLLMRTVKLVSPPSIHSGDEMNHLDFDGPPISITQIMSAVQTFWNS